MFISLFLWPFRFITWFLFHMIRGSEQKLSNICLLVESFIIIFLKDLLHLFPKTSWAIYLKDILFIYS